MRDLRARGRVSGRAHVLLCPGVARTPRQCYSSAGRAAAACQESANYQGGRAAHKDAFRDRARFPGVLDPRPCHRLRCHGDRAVVPQAVVSCDVL